jgi:hypothetical protein
VCYRILRDDYYIGIVTHKGASRARDATRRPSTGRPSRRSSRSSRSRPILQEEQQKLVQLYYKGGVSEEVLTAEQQRIEAERTRLTTGSRLPPTKPQTSWRRSTMP